METETERLQYAAAIACGILAALAVHIALTVAGTGLDAVLRGMVPTDRQQATAALAWWAIGLGGFVGALASGRYLSATAGSRAVIAAIARRALIAMVLAVCTAAGVMSKTGGPGGSLDVATNLTALVIGLLTAYAGARLAYQKPATRDI